LNELPRALPVGVARSVFDDIIRVLPFDATNNSLVLPVDFQTEACRAFCVTASEAQLRAKLKSLATAAVYNLVGERLLFDSPAYGDLVAVADEVPAATAPRLALNATRAEARRKILRDLYTVFTLGTKFWPFNCARVVFEFSLRPPPPPPPPSPFEAGARAVAAIPPLAAVARSSTEYRTHPHVVDSNARPGMTATVARFLLRVTCGGSHAPKY
jgi:hypothetical protein